jgi:hypothetical protein
MRRLQLVQTLPVTFWLLRSQDCIVHVKTVDRLTLVSQGRLDGSKARIVATKNTIREADAIKRPSASVDPVSRSSKTGSMADPYHMIQLRGRI